MTSTAVSLVSGDYPPAVIYLMPSETPTRLIAAGSDGSSTPSASILDAAPKDARQMVLSLQPEIADRQVSIEMLERLYAWRRSHPLEE